MELRSRQLIEVNPKEAENYLKFNKFESQRKINSLRVSYLAEAIKNGYFTGADIALATNGDGIMYLVNGQHCCKAIVDAGRPVKVTLSKYYCEDKTELSHLFRQFDSGMNTRSMVEVLNVERDVLGKQHWDFKLSSLLASAAIIVENGFSGITSRYKFTRDVRAELIRKYSEEGDFLNDIIGASNEKLADRFLRRAAVAAAMIATYKKSKHHARIFWESVRDGVGLKKNSPQLRLRDYLAQLRVTGKQQNREIYCKCIHAWNADRTGEITNLAYFSAAKVPRVK